MPTDGHYAGATAQGAPISFDVVGGGTEVTNVVAVFSAPPGGRAAVLTIRGRLPVDSEGAWEADVRSGGLRGRVLGRLGTNGVIRGSIEADPAGPIAWEARRVTGVLAADG